MLSNDEKKILTAIAEVTVPPGKFFGRGGEADVQKLDRFLESHRGFSIAYRLALYLLELSPALAPPFRRFSRQSLEQRETILWKWRNGNPLQIAAIDLLCDPLKTAHFSDEGVYSRLGCVWNKNPAFAPKPPYMRQVRPASELSNGEVLECDVVVVGTGAGGAVVAKELAEKGCAVLLLEEGKYWTRKDFSGHLVDATKNFYRNRGLTFALGNTLIPVLMGRMVGGSTAVNTGTCWRTPPWILDKWANELGLSELSPAQLEPYFERVERILQVAPPSEETLGGIAKVIARGCDRLGYHHFPLLRNAPDCDGQGTCTFGCPTDARRSTNISYVPLALRTGALLMEEARATKVLIDRGTAVGVEAASVRTGKRFSVRAKGVVLACGAIMTPSFLLSQKICNSSRCIGRNLTLHPAVNVCALLPDDEIAFYKHVPQGYCIDTFHRKGILLLGTGLPIDASAAVIPLVGRKFSEVMSELDHVASFGVLVEDRPSGRVVVIRGKPQIFYWLRKRELSLLKFGIEVLTEVFLAAGAKEVYPLHRRSPTISSRDDLKRFREKSFPPSSFRVASFHPLGTCRMGIDPNRSVVNPSHETHDLKKLFICDGSVVPTSVGVNPQETIMALSTRGADQIAKRID